MPNQTFFNLPDEKREQILKIAIDEFANNDYDSASISRIVARAGIAKGSFYQYFAGKEDLYAYLLDLIAEKKTQFMSLDHPDPQHIGVFAYLRWLAQMGVAFELAYPELIQIGYRAVTAGPYPAAAYARARAAALAFYHRLVELGKQQGDIAADLDGDLAAFIFDAILTNLGSFILQRVGENHFAERRRDQALFELPEVQELFTRTVSMNQFEAVWYES